MMKKIFFTIIVAFLPVIFCINCKENKEIIINHASKDTLVVVQSESEIPATLVFNVSGTIDDTCKIMGISIDKNNLNKDIFVDAYSKKMLLDYKAFKVKKGNVIIKYRY